MASSTSNGSTMLPYRPARAGRTAVASCVAMYRAKATAACVFDGKRPRLTDSPSHVAEPGQPVGRHTPVARLSPRGREQLEALRLDGSSSRGLGSGGGGFVRAALVGEGEAGQRAVGVVWHRVLGLEPIVEPHTEARLPVPRDGRLILNHSARVPAARNGRRRAGDRRPHGAHAPADQPLVVHLRLGRRRSHRPRRLVRLIFTRPEHARLSQRSRAAVLGHVDAESAGATVFGLAGFALATPHLLLPQPQRLVGHHHTRRQAHRARGNRTGRPAHSCLTNCALDCLRLAPGGFGLGRTLRTAYPVGLLAPRLPARLDQAPAAVEEHALHMGLVGYSRSPRPLLALREEGALEGGGGPTANDGRRVDAHVPKACDRPRGEGEHGRERSRGARSCYLRSEGSEGSGVVRHPGRRQRTGLREQRRLRHQLILLLACCLTRARRHPLRRLALPISEPLEAHRMIGQCHLLLLLLVVLVAAVALIAGG
eukprot:scaffold6456_cov98-Isochrysis_galbana.AAC.7